MNSPDPGPFPFPTSERHDAPPAQPVRPVEQPTTESALDHGIEESFPASDPVSVNVTKAKAAPAPPRASGDRHGGGAAGASSTRQALLSGLTTGTLAGIACSLALAPRRRRGAGGSTAWVLGAFAAGMALGCAAGARREGDAQATRQG
ncbi:MAG: hypothetical protein J7549_05275 [Variovorax sp.]|nr:hypothetical protein [Variovorax sp.]